ncbi:MAG TPA: phospholipase D-like domain-containing protein [Thermohalobaculum sp.]|nr:phospholipase D-like domain-containing protein [Thermohalobaculum sp.]
MEGPAAGALADTARDRWQWATGHRPVPARAGAPSDCWPGHLAPDIEDVEVAIARTYPAWKGRGAVREVEALFRDTIARAEHTLYIENQYFTATRIARAVLDRLGEDDCPEIVLVVPQAPTGWLEQSTMGTRQRYLLARLRQADRHGRLRVYMPVVGAAGEVAIKVHAKVMVADGRFVRVGSANLNNRSMGLDSECDLALESAAGTAPAQAITRLRGGWPSTSTPRPTASPARSRRAAR